MRNRPLRTKTVSARVDEETFEKLSKWAKEEKQPVSELLRRIIEDRQ